MDVVNELPKLQLGAVKWSYAKYVQAVLGERARLVEAAQIDFAADVDPSRGDAKDAQFTETTEGETGTDGQGGR